MLIRPFSYKYAERGEHITEAVLPLKKYSWFRAVVTDEFGNKACSSVYFADEINEAVNGICQPDAGE